MIFFVKEIIDGFKLLNYGGISCQKGTKYEVQCFIQGFGLRHLVDIIYM